MGRSAMSREGMRHLFLGPETARRLPGMVPREPHMSYIVLMNVRVCVSGGV